MWIPNAINENYIFVFPIKFIYVGVYDLQRGVKGISASSLYVMITSVDYVELFQRWERCMKTSAKENESKLL